MSDRVCCFLRHFGVGEDFSHRYVFSLMGALVDGRLTSESYPVSPVKPDSIDSVLGWQLL